MPELRRHAGPLLALLCLLAALWPAPPAASAKEPTLRYRTLLTAGASEGQALPLLIAVHGWGDTPRGFVGLFEDLPIQARVILPGGPDLRKKGGLSWYPIRGASPEQTEQGLRRSVALVLKLMRSVQREQPTLGKPVLTGFSQGGAVSFAMAALHPEALGSALPISGYLPLEPGATAKRGKGLVVNALHGEADEVVPVHKAERAVKTLRERGARAALHRFPRRGHSVLGPMRKKLHALLVEALEAQVAAGS